MSQEAATPPPVGAPAPFFRARALSGNPSYVFDTTAGRVILLGLLGSAAAPACRQALADLLAHRAVFNDTDACFFGVTCDPADESESRIAQALPGIRFFLDYDRAVSGLYGAFAKENGTTTYRPHWLVLDPALRIMGRFPITETAAAMALVRGLIAEQGRDQWAPVLEIRHVLEPALCDRLVRYYEEHGGEDSGFMREVDGKTVGRIDYAHKRREDCTIEDSSLIQTLQNRVFHAVRPMIRRAFQFDVTRMERYIVACYDDETGGHFNAHRDNTTKGTAHRRFAVSINLNAGEYEGGGLTFPEFGPRIYHPARGGAVVFSCSLLHRALPVTRGRRYAFLPFLYDDAAADIRRQNLSYLAN